MTKLKCPKCGKIFEIPEGTCPICFDNVLGHINETKDEDERFEKLSEFINELTAFDYERGEHNAKCENQMDIDCCPINFEEVEEDG